MNDKRTETHACDSISRQAAIDELVRWGKIPDYNDGERNVIACTIGMLSALPATQPEPAIPISWLEKEIEHLESRKNCFAVMDAAYLKALIKRWRGGQNDTE